MVLTNTYCRTSSEKYSSEQFYSKDNPLFSEIRIVMHKLIVVSLG